MIYYLVREEHAKSMHEFLTGWGEALADRITIMYYERVLAGKSVRLPAGTYIFTSLADLGEPGSELREEAGRLYQELAGAFGASRVINDPLTFLRRFDLLETLHARGINDFAVYRAGGPRLPQRYPVYLRWEYGSRWDVPPLLKNEAEYRAAVAGENDLSYMIAIEFNDTGDAAGIYRKYSCFIVGDRIVPRHLFFSRSWFVKQADLHEPWMEEEELAFLASNPHAEMLREVSRIAGLGYGRVDYALLDGRVQIWEINHTPMIAGAMSSEISTRASAHYRFLALMTEALNAIDPDGA